MNEIYNSEVVTHTAEGDIIKGPINNIPALNQVMAWCQPGDKPLSDG